MLLKIYYIGLIATIFWWGILSIITFEDKYYEILDDGVKDSVDDLRNTLNNFPYMGPKTAFLFVSFITIFLWPFFLLWMIWSKFQK